MKLRELLANKEWPSLYMFKFIFEDDIETYAKIEAIFSDTAEITTNESKKGKYLSMTIRVMCMSPEEVIDKYKEVGKIKGIIAL